MFYTRRLFGFTLIELLIVIAVIFFLAKLIAPRYSSFYAKAQQTEVMLNLSTLYAAEQAYNLQHGRFTSNLAQLDWKPRGYTSSKETTQNKYTYASGSDRQEGVTLFSGTHEAPEGLSTGCVASGQAFLFKAGYTSEGRTELWTLDQTGEVQQER